MSTEKEKYQKFYESFNDAVLGYLSKQANGPYANVQMKLKMLSYMAACLVLYFSMFLVDHVLAFGALYLLCGISIFLMNLNMAHDAVHNGIFRREFLNQFIFDFSFHFLGNSGHLWKVNHETHHAVPNIEGKDPDLIEHVLFRLTPDQKWRPFHKFQAFYAPFLYLLHSPVHYLITENALIFFNRDLRSFPLSERLKTILSKILHISYFVIFPYYFTDFSLGTILILFFVLLMQNSLMIVFFLGLSHLNAEVAFYNESVWDTGQSGIEVQFKSSLDFSTKSKIAHFFLGGFNTHTLHHLIPHVSHIHYRGLVEVLEKTALDHGLNYKQVSYLQILRYHFRLLHTLGQKPKNTRQNAFIPA